MEIMDLFVLTSVSLSKWARSSTLLPSLFPPLLLPWLGCDNPPLLLPKARSPLDNSVTCLSGHISMEDLQSQTSASMDWLSKFTQSAFTLQTPAQFHLEMDFKKKKKIFTFAFASNLTSPLAQIHRLYYRIHYK